MLLKHDFVSKVAFKIVLNILPVFSTRIFARYQAYYMTYPTSHSAYVATDTESNGAKIDGF